VKPTAIHLSGCAFRFVRPGDPPLPCICDDLMRQIDEDAADRLRERGWTCIPPTDD